MVWIDARGLDTPAVAQNARDVAHRFAPDVRVGAAETAIAAHVAAAFGTDDNTTIVPPRHDAAFLAPHPYTVLAPPPKLAAALASVGLVTCGDLARLPLEAIEVRFGADGAALWRLARADDPRRIFSSELRTLPSSSLVWEEYALRTTEQLLFVANRLMTTVCTELQTWGEAARGMTMTLTLTDRTVVERPLRVSRETANRSVWMRRLRIVLEQLRIGEGVTGLDIRVDAVGRPATPQGDIFDQGFQTARAIHDVLDRLQDDGDAGPVVLISSRHPLPEHRIRCVPSAVDDLRPAGSLAASPPRLVLQVFPDAPRVEITTVASLPARLRSAERGMIELVMAIGPDHASGDTAMGTPYCREYFTCLTDHGLLLLLFRDVVTDAWHLQGWWD